MKFSQSIMRLVIGYIVALLALTWIAHVYFRVPLTLYMGTVARREPAHPRAGMTPNSGCAGGINEQAFH